MLSTANDQDGIEPKSQGVLSSRQELKEEFSTSAYEVDPQSSSELDTNNVKSSSRRWETTLLRIGPIAGICALLFAALSMVVALAILLSSRGDPKRSWGVPPSSLLAICTAVGNQALRFAAFQGVAIAWWFKVLRGSTMARLQDDWYSGTHVLGALAAGRRMGWIGLACIFSTLVAIDGPFMQRATTVNTAPISSQPVKLNVTISPEWPTYVGAGYVVEGGFADRWRPLFNESIPSSNGSIPNSVIPVAGSSFISQVGKPYWVENPFPDFIRGCSKAKCRAKVKAPALAVSSCRSSIIPISTATFLDTVTPESVLNLNAKAPPINQMAFIVQTSLNIKNEQESIDLVTAFAKMPTCTGTINLTMCTLMSAVGEYDVSIEDGRVTLDRPITPKIISMANNAPVSTTIDPKWNYYDSTLAGVAVSNALKWDSWSVGVKKEGVYSFTDNNPGVAETFAKAIYPYRCSSYSDPREDVIQSMNEFMFYSGVLIPTLVSDFKSPEVYEGVLDPGLQVETTVTGHIEGGFEEIFDTDIRYFVIAAIIEGISIFLILPTYIGFWKLGRHVTFSPLEIAKAFEAPMLASCNSNSSARDMKKKLGDEEIQYGAYCDASSNGKTKLAFAKPSIVKPPQKGTLYD